MAEIKLVSKFYPVANYSYPSPLSPTNPSSKFVDRSSVGSEASAPGLVDDRTDSEVSQEDDYQLQCSNTTGLWDSFWQAGGEWRLEDAPLKQPLRSVKQQCPASLSSRAPKRCPPPAETDGASWPLPDPATSSSTRKHIATYSAFPSLKPTPRASSLVPAAPLSPRPSTANNTAAGSSVVLGPPPRPRRPEALLSPCIRQPSQALAARTSTVPAIPPRTDSRRPKTSAGTTHCAQPPPPPSSSGMGGHHSRSRSNILSIHSGAASRSSEDLTRVDDNTRQASHGPRHYKSATYLGAARHQQRQLQLQLQLQEQQQQQQQQAEPHSVFEDDSDCEEPAGISFFRFHKRSSSDKSCKGSAAGTQGDSAVPRKGRDRADTVPASPATKRPSSERERKVDVFGRMLGRRSR
ncbi:hypothetical protein V2A60_002090 [Cordyceps javanica]